MKKLGLTLYCILIVGVFYGQERVSDEKQSAIDQIIELVSENLETEELDFTTFLEDLNLYYNRPLNLNRATRDELERLLFLTPFQIEALIDHINQTGKFRSIYELQAVEGFDISTINALLPFVDVAESSARPDLRWSAIKEESSQEAFIRYQRVLEQVEGFAPIDDSTLQANPNRRYLGDPARILTRYRFRYLNNISVGITGEKDAGEEFFQGTQPQGFDFYSAHAYFGNYGAVKHAIIGDYQIQLGQGLTYWTGLAFGKSADITSIKRSAREITPYVSADENNFQRGAAATIKLWDIEVTSFFSSKGVDANLSEIDTSETDGEFVVSEFSSFQLNGFHRTPGELADRKSIREINTGSHIRLVKDKFEIGATGVYTNYSGNFLSSTQLYRSFEPVSNSFLVGGFDYQLSVRNVLAFGEFSQRFDGGTAFLNGAIISVDPRFDISIYHRHFDASYVSPRSNAVSESSRNTNEEGFYIGFSAALNRKWKFSGFYDAFRFPWMRFQAKAPTSGSEYLAQLEYKPSRSFIAYARYRFEDKLEGFDLGNQPTDEIGNRHRHWYRLNWQLTINKVLSLRNRLEFIHVDLPEGESENGWLVYQDVVFKPKWPAKYSFKLRYALFETESYDSRLYAYEHDVLYSFSVPAYYSRGSRAYLITQYDITRWSDLTVRLARTFFSDRSTNGSGLNEIDGPNRTDIRIQYRVKF